MLASAPSVVLDVGGTTVLAGLVDDDGRVSATRHDAIDNSAPRDALLDRLAGEIDRLLPLTGPDAPVVIGFPAPFDYEAGVAWLDHKFGALHGLDLRAALSERLAIGPERFRFCNDAVAAGTGEVAALDDPSGRIWVVLLGTGLGSALVVDGEVALDSGVGNSTELWRRLLPDGRLADAVVSASGLAAALDVPAHDLPTLLGPGELASSTADALGRWVDDVAAVLGPVLAVEPADHVVLGGGAAAALPHFGAELSARLGVPVIAARGGRHAALVGAARATR